MSIPGLLEAALLLVPIQSHTSCPDESAVVDSLARLESKATAKQSSEEGRVVIERFPNSVRVSWVSSEGRILTERELPADAPCAELADATALMIDAGMAERPPLEPPARPEAPPPTVPVRQPGPIVKPAPEAAVASRPPRAEKWALLLGGGGGISERRWAPELTFGATRRWGERGGMSFGLLAQLEANRWIDLELGRVRWNRQAVGMEAGWSGRWRRFGLDLMGRVLFARLHASGKGFDRDLEAAGFAVGVGPHVRISVPLGRLSPWLALGAEGWPARPELRVRGGLTSRAPFRYSLEATIGLRYAFY